ncbi:TPA: OmpA family protein [Vibrio campbellii]
MVMKRIAICLFTSCITYNAMASNDFYLGGKTGWTHFANGCESHRLDCDKDDIGAGIYLGYKINDWLAVEGGYDYFGDAKAVYPSLGDPSIKAPYSAEVQGIELGLVSQYNLTEKLSILGKVGALGWKADKTGKELDYTVNEEDKDISLMLGAGLEYRLSHNWGARLEYQWFDNVGGKDTGGSDINFLTVGLNYTFGSKEEPVSKSVEPIPTKVIEAQVLTFNEFNGEALFAFDSSELSVNAKSYLRDVLLRLQKNEQSELIIIGHTDSLGSESYNKELSTRRAESVAYYFQSQGISKSRIQVEGKGETSPIADNKTPEGRAMNRRVEIISPSFSVEVENE